VFVPIGVAMYELQYAVIYSSSEAVIHTCTYRHCCPCINAARTIRLSYITDTDASLLCTSCANVMR
jgi:hypothetical protein